MRQRTTAATMLCTAALAISLSRAGTADELRVAATVAPIHSLVAMVGDGVIEPDMIIPPGASPHNYALKPSEAAALDGADVVFWVGEALEPWMAKAVTTLAADALVVELGEVDGIERLAFREEDGFAAGDHGSEHHNDHHEEHDHGHGHDHDGAFDPHLWLNPDNASIWLETIAEALAARDPDHGDLYRNNAKAAALQIEQTTAEIEALLEPVSALPYVVFHDAYQYFEHRFGLRPIGAISLSDASRPGPSHLKEVRAAITESGAVCVFAEPQFEPKLIETVIEGIDIGKGTLDPIGAGLQPGAELYPALLRGLADGLVDCLG